MTVVDLRERFGLGRLSASIPSPRRSPELVGSLDGREFHRAPHPAPMWRVAVLDGLAASAGALAAAVAWGSLGTATALALIAAWLVALYSVGAYRRSLLGSQVRAARPVVRAIVGLSAGVALLSLVAGGLDVRATTWSVVATGALTFVGRRLWGESLLGRVTDAPVTTLVRGRGEDVAEMLARLDAEPQALLAVAAVQVTDGRLPADLASRDVHVFPDTHDVVAAALDASAGAVLLAGPQPEASEDLRRVLWRLEGHGLAALVAPLVADVAAPRTVAMPRTGIPVLDCTARDMGAESGIAKMVIDRGLALLALIALAPVLGLIALAVKRTSEGPVLFRQVRVGLHGATFEMLKFRTMHVDAEARRAELEALNRHAGGTLFKIADDPRITTVGRFLRKLSLDELPQLINVVRGEMSLVGPRPPLPSEVANYPLDAHRRFCVRPGLTGLWQVSGRSDLDPEESVRLDTHYVEHWCLANDVAILARTPGVVLRGEGAY